MKTRSEAEHPPSEDCRCVCGRLVARVVPGGLQLKCRRCKRTMFVALPPALTPDGSTPQGSLERGVG